MFGRLFTGQWQRIRKYQRLQLTTMPGDKRDSTRAENTYQPRDEQDDALRVDEAEAGERRRGLTSLKPADPTSSDEVADGAMQNAENPMLVREEVKNTSDSSGVRANDEAKGEVIKEQLKRGMTNVQPLD